MNSTKRNNTYVLQFAGDSLRVNLPRGISTRFADGNTGPGLALGDQVVEVVVSALMVATYRIRKTTLVVGRAATNALVDARNDVPIKPALGESNRLCGSSIQS